MSHAKAHRILRRAEAHDFYILEDDVYSVLKPDTAPPLASLDQLNRVIYVNGFSKTLSPRLRVGFLAASPELVACRLDLKLLTHVVTSKRSVLSLSRTVATGFSCRCAVPISPTQSRLRTRRLHVTCCWPRWNVQPGRKTVAVVAVQRRADGQARHQRVARTARPSVVEKSSGATARRLCLSRPQPSQYP